MDPAALALSGCTPGCQAVVRRMATTEALRPRVMTCFPLFSRGLRFRCYGTPRTSRHMCASWLVQTGVPLYEVQCDLGHSSIQTAHGYAQLAPNCAQGDHQQV